MKMLLPPEATRASPPHCNCANTAKDNNHQDTDGDCQHCHHRDWVLDWQSDTRSQDPASIINQKIISSFVWSLNTPNFQSASVAIFLGVWFRFEWGKSASKLSVLKAETAPFPGQWTRRWVSTETDRQHGILTQSNLNCGFMRCQQWQWSSTDLNPYFLAVCHPFLALDNVPCSASPSSLTVISHIPESKTMTVNVYKMRQRLYFFYYFNTCKYLISFKQILWGMTWNF